jgi:transposase
MDMDKTEWRVYRIEDKQDLAAAIALYEKRKGVRPRYARVSEKAPAWLLTLLEEADGLEIERVSNLLSFDVWLTHEKKAEPQMSLFGEAG